MFLSMHISHQDFIFPSYIFFVVLWHEKIFSSNIFDEHATLMFLKGISAKCISHTSFIL